MKRLEIEIHPYKKSSQDGPVACWAWIEIDQPAAPLPYAFGRIFKGNERNTVMRESTMGSLSRVDKLIEDACCLLGYVPVWISMRVSNTSPRIECRSQPVPFQGQLCWRTEMRPMNTTEPTPYGPPEYYTVFSRAVYDFLHYVDTKLETLEKPEP